MTSCQLLSACFDYIINNYIIKRTYIINSASLLPATATAVLFDSVSHHTPDVKTAFRGDDRKARWPARATLCPVRNAAVSQ